MAAISILLSCDSVLRLASITLLNPSMMIVITAQKCPYSFQTIGQVSKNQGCRPLVHLQRVIRFFFLMFASE